MPHVGRWLFRAFLGNLMVGTRDLDDSGGEVDDHDGRLVGSH